MSKKSDAMRKLQGGFSDAVFNSPELSAYVNSYNENPYVGGYLGQSGRSKTKDRIVENELRATGLGSNGIGSWLTSTDARHLMDEGSDIEDTKKFIKHVKEWVKDAFMNVLVWSHPDHTGFLSDTVRLKKAIVNALKAEDEREFREAKRLMEEDRSACDGEGIFSR